MSLKEIAERAEQEIREKRRREREMLEEIQDLTSHNFAIKAEAQLNHRRQCYSFGYYLHQLSNLKALIKIGMPEIDALDAVQTGMDVEEIISKWRGEQ